MKARRERKEGRSQDGRADLHKKLEAFQRHYLLRVIHHCQYSSLGDGGDIITAKY